MSQPRLLLSVVLLVAIAACGGNDAPTADDPDSTGASTAAFFQDLEPDWSANLVNDRSYGVRVEFNGSSTVGDVFAEVAYPGYDCAGSWILLEIDGVSVKARESISINPEDICADNGLVQLIRSESSLDYEWSYSTGELSDTATLFAG